MEGWLRDRRRRSGGAEGSEPGGAGGCESSGHCGPLRLSGRGCWPGAPRRAAFTDQIISCDRDERSQALHPQHTRLMDFQQKPPHAESSQGEGSSTQHSCTFSRQGLVDRDTRGRVNTERVE